ncbi:MAG: hypothetical protein ABI862_15480, partial [Ilumatobacteraceae bacterium]
MSLTLVAYHAAHILPAQASRLLQLRYAPVNSEGQPREHDLAASPSRFSQHHADGVVVVGSTGRAGWRIR